MFELQTLSDPSDAELKVLDRFVANQFFFFFKDIAHVHQHHDPSHDAITELTLIDNGETDNWIPETQHALYRAVIRYKRFRNSRALFRASGILAYARAFEKAHAEGHPKFKLFNYEALDASLSVSREEIQHVDAKKSASAETVRNYFFTVLGIAFSLFAFAQLDKNFVAIPNENMIWLATVFATEPFKCIGLVFFASYAAGYLTDSRDPADSSPVRAILRWFQGFRMRWFVAANLSMALIFALIFYYVFFVLFSGQKAS